MRLASPAFLETLVHQDPTELTVLLERREALAPLAQVGLQVSPEQEDPQALLEALAHRAPREHQ